MAYRPTDVLTTESQIRDVVDGIHDAQKSKVLDHIDRHSQFLIELSPFFFMSRLWPFPTAPETTALIAFATSLIQDALALFLWCPTATKWSA